MGHRGRFERQKPKKKGGKIALIVVLVLIVLLAAGVAGGMIYYNHMLDKITQVEADPTDVDPDVLLDLLPTVVETEPVETVTETTVPETKPMTADDIVNIMVVGDSSRAGQDSKLADTAILVTINKYTKTVTLTSVLRDSLVKFPDFKDANGKQRYGGKIKFTTCYNLGYKYGNMDVAWAMKIINMVMEENFGVEVDYNFEVDFEGFMLLVDKLGGVTLELTQAEADYLNAKMDNYLEAEEGPEHLDGYAALVYARMRKAKGDSDSDIKRTSRQRYLIEQLFQQMLTNDISTINQTITEVLPYITTNMTKEQINKLLLDVIPILPELKIESGTCPVEGTHGGKMYDIYGNGLEESVITFNPAEQKKLMRAITEGEIPAE